MTKHTNFMSLLAGLVMMTSVFAQNKANGVQRELPVPTHADAAVILAKYSGLFDRYVASDASLNECVTFLNKNGIYFGLMEIVNDSEFTLGDCARVMGQMNLIFSGEAGYQAGKVKLPSGVDSWESFCILNDVQFVQGYKNLVTTLDMLHNLSQ